YVVVAPGLAVSVAPVVADSPVAGDQLYVVAPVAVSVVPVPPAQIATSGDTPTVGCGFTVTVTVAVLLHPAVVPVTVYVVVAPGLDLTSVVYVADIAVAGDQLYVVAP